MNYYIQTTKASVGNSPFSKLKFSMMTDFHMSGSTRMPYLLMFSRHSLIPPKLRSRKAQVMTPSKLLNWDDQEKSESLCLWIL